MLAQEAQPLSLTSLLLRRALLREQIQMMRAKNGAPVLCLRWLLPGSVHVMRSLQSVQPVTWSLCLDRPGLCRVRAGPLRRRLTMAAYATVLRTVALLD